MSVPHVAVVIVNWNNLADTTACLGSLSHCTYPAMTILVVDNASTDSSADAIASNFPHIPLLRNPRNLGFTGGNNVGIKAAFERGADYVLLLNNDTEVAPEFLGLLVETLETEPQAWAATPLIYYFKQPNMLWAAGGKIDFKRATADMLGTGDEDRGQFGKVPFEADYATGCAILVRRSMVEKFGLLDERFFMYYEEVEWCTRMRQQGLKVMIVPGSKIWHKIDPASRNESPFVHYLMTRNRLLWAKTSAFGSQVFWRVLFLENLRTLISWSIRPKWKHKKKLKDVMWQAILDVFRNRVGPPSLPSVKVKNKILLEGNGS